jgi:hypothetical protein
VAADQLPIAAAPLTGQDVAVVVDAVRIEVEKTRFAWGALLRDGWLGKTSTSGRYENPVQGPSVVIRNAQGDKLILAATKTVKEARDRAAAAEKDFETLDTAQWCERYNVPPSFVSVRP